MSKNYNINIKKLAVMLIPPFLRQPVIIATATALVIPVNSIKKAFDQEREDILFDMSINSSICRLEYMLNYIFYKPSLKESYIRRIHIKTADYIRGVYIRSGGREPEWSTDEESPLPIYDRLQENKPVIIRTRTEMGTGWTKSNFIVMIPIERGDLGRDEPYFRKLLNDFKLPDKNYNIEYYS
jgi:hypothetical protein